MTDALLKGIIAAASAEDQTREGRAAHVAQIIRDRRRYRWVGIYDIDETDEGVLLAESGQGPSGEHLSLPLLGPETGALMGTLDIEGTQALSRDDEAFLDECADAMRALFE
ncbi:MAG TPA: hypothetical protein VGN11_07900 [Candidatus Baltobacteraceae bacterium]|nr:hypothetical protein [Candidatus Baltobacteraceae bacterium]